MGELEYHTRILKTKKEHKAPIKSLPERLLVNPLEFDFSL
jgi:hypothetical protein